MSSPKERQKRNRRASGKEEREIEEDEEKNKTNDSAETEEILICPLLSPAARLRQQALTQHSITLQILFNNMSTLVGHL